MKFQARLWRVLISMIIIFVFFLDNSLLARVITETVTHAGCTITIKRSIPIGQVSDTQERADVEAVKNELDEALDQSEDMQEKVEEACEKHGGSLTIELTRDHPTFLMGGARPNQGWMILDMGDIEGIGEALEGGSAEARQNVADTALIRNLAHEMDHLRDGPGENAHADPYSTDKFFQKGPAVEDANKVIDDITETPNVRTSYLSAPLLIDDKKIGTQFDVDLDGDGNPDETVDLDGTKLSKRDQGRSLVPANNSSLTHIIDFDMFASIPSKPCSNGNNGCYPLAMNYDSDLDGVTDTLDNCPHVVNPQQGNDCSTIPALEVNIHIPNLILPGDKVNVTGIISGGTGPYTVIFTYPWGSNTIASLRSSESGLATFQVSFFVPLDITPGSYRYSVNIVDWLRETGDSTGIFNVSQSAGFAPQITNVVVPNSMQVGETRVGSISFTDPDADISLISLFSESWSPKSVSWNPNVQGQTSGTVSFEFGCGSEPLQISALVTLQDKRGNTSETWRFSYNCIEPAQHNPIITGIAFPATVSLGQMADGFVHFSDVDGDITTITLTSESWEPSSISWDPGVLGQTSGSIGYRSGCGNVEQDIVVLVQLTDANGNLSAPSHFSYMCI